MQKCRAVDPKGGGFDEGIDEGFGDEHAAVFSGLGGVLEHVAGGGVDPVDGDAELGEVEKGGAVFVGEEVPIGEGGVLEVDPFEAALDKVAEEEAFHERGGEVAAKEDPLGGDEAVFDAFEEGVFRLLLDIALDEEGLLGGIEEAGEFALVGLALDPVAGFKMEELLSFDDEDGGAVRLGQGGCFKGIEQGSGVFKAGLELVAVGEEDVFAVGLEGVELDGDGTDLFA